MTSTLPTRNSAQPYPTKHAQPVTPSGVPPPSYSFAGRCRANLVQIRQSRPDYGLGLNHVQCESLYTHISPARQRFGLSFHPPPPSLPSLLLVRVRRFQHPELESFDDPGLSESREKVHPFFFFFTLVTGARRSLNLKLSDTRVYEPQIRAHLGTTAHF